METISVQFFNAEGEAMFKVYVGRDEDRRLRADQVERFLQLQVRLAGAGTH
jgi:putative heme iron utilization protein